MRIHADERPYKTFKQSSYLSKHMKINGYDSISQPKPYLNVSSEFTVKKSGLITSSISHSNIADCAKSPKAARR